MHVIYESQGQVKFTTLAQNSDVEYLINNNLMPDLPWTRYIIVDQNPSKKFSVNWEAGTFTDEEVSSVVPHTVSRFQARIALYTHNLLSTVETFVKNNGVYVIWYEDILEWHRDDPVLLSVANQLGLTEAQLDALFIEAATY